MKKNYVIGILGLIVVLAIGAMVYICSDADMHALAAEVTPFTQLPEGATAEVTLLKTMLRYASQLLPSL